MAGPGDRERGTGDREQGLSSLAEGYRKAGPYLGASTTLVASIGAFLWLGVWLDRKLGNEVPWFTLLGAIVGAVGGFVSFFRVVLRSSKHQ